MRVLNNREGGHMLRSILVLIWAAAVVLLPGAVWADPDEATPPLKGVGVVSVKGAITPGLMGISSGTYPGLKFPEPKRS